MPGRPAAVVFDMDGVLFDSEALYRQSLFAAAQELGHRFTTEDFLELVGRPWADNRLALQARIGAAGDVDLLRATWMRRYEASAVSLALKPGVRELLACLDGLRLPRAICTSSSRQDVRRNLDLHGLGGRFDAVVAAGDYARGKPAPDPFLRAAEALAVAPGSCLALEDSYNGVRAAAAAGMRTVMVPDLLPPTAEMHRLCAFVAADLHAVRAHLTRTPIPKEG